MRVFLILPVLVVAMGCATNTPQPEPVAAGPRLMPAGYSEPAAGDDVCQPNIVDGRTVLSDDCLNVIDRSPTAGRQIHAVGRETKQLRSLCENMVLPKCRRKY